MKKWTCILGLAIGAVAHGDTEEPGLVLALRQIDIRILENLGSMKLQLKVTNPTNRSQEGIFAFSAPSGAAVYEADVTKHISSKARMSKVVAPDLGAALYGMDKQRILGGTEDLAISYLMHRNGHGDDPALVELISPDRYRIRFNPVPAGDDQTVTVLLSFEVRKSDSSFGVEIPLGFVSNFRVDKTTRFETRMDFRSGDLQGAPTSSTHRLEMLRKSQGNHQVLAAADDDAGKSELALRYELGASARPFDFAQEGKARPHPLMTGEDRAACQAIRSKRLLLEAAEPARPALGLSSNLVSRYGSLLVMEDSLAIVLTREEGQALRLESPSVLGATKEQALECDFVRAAAGLPALLRSAPCGLRAASTSDPAKVRWAQDCGLLGSRPPAASSAATFEYVRHGRGCPLHQASPEKLRRLVELLE